LPRSIEVNVEDGVLVEFTYLVVMAAVVGALATLLRQPLIVGFIVVGVAAGPSGLDVLGDTEAWDLLSVAGISILLFVVGLRLDLDEVRDTGVVALIVGSAQVVVTFGAGLAVSLALRMDLVSALYVAIALTFSSTIIVVKLLSDKREIDSLHGRISVGILIVQDLLVVAVMIAVSAVGVEGDGDTLRLGLEVVLKGALMVVGLAIAMRWFIHPLFSVLGRSQELLVLGAIAWAMSFAVLGEELGFSTEVGAFLAGISLASTRFRDAIGGRLVSLRDFMLLFFFVTLGASLDLSLLGSQLGMAIVLASFVLLGKPLIVMGVMGMMGYRARTGFLAGLTLAQISEFSLILGTLGLGVGHIDEDTLALITLVGLITIAVSAYGISYSHAIYDLVAPALGRFERADPRRETNIQSHERAEIVVLGIGRFGGEILQRLVDRGRRTMGIDFDPQVVRFWEARGIQVKYGDAEDPELYNSIPLSASWVVSTLPTLHANRHLMEVLRERGYRGRLALTAHRRAVADAMTNAGADLVLVPFAEAAVQAADYLCGDEAHPHGYTSRWIEPATGEESIGDVDGRDGGLV
jgi:Kef-type K+ transport system membrane component KefB